MTGVEARERWGLSAGHGRQRGSRGLVLCLFAVAAGLSPGAGGEEAWRPVANVSGVRVLALSTASGFDIHRAGVAVCTSLETVATFTRDASRFEEWVAFTLEARLIESNDEHTLYYLKNRAPWPVRPRDMVYELTPRFDASGALHIAMRGLPDYLPPVRGVVRMDSVSGEWLFRVDGSEVAVQLTLHAEPGERVPKYFANRRLAQTVGRTLASLAARFPCSTPLPEGPAQSP